MTGSRAAVKAEKQKTIQSEVVAAGIGLFTGEKVSLKIKPAPVNTGIVFVRSDLPDRPRLPAHLSFVRETPRCTRLADAKASVQMVEHLLSALAGMGVDNAIVEVEGPEILAADGSAKLFVELIGKVGLTEQNAARKRIKIHSPIYWSDKEAHLIALPADEFRVSYTMHYPQSDLLKSQFYTVSVNPDTFQEEIAPCRTFSLYEEILPFIEKGMIKGGGLDNALVIKGNQIMNPEGARFPDEMVRHKILDLIGDLRLIGSPIVGHIISVRSGHSSNIAFAKMIAKLEEV
ncbi:MAG: UDP-3-O-[3-hydroxymyristoyl] N-acetylglucosamine deacetylase [Verrucomicrobia bacterium]|nr:UDP-3-O-[3-hydroxymyristoyl] N-acetylglucosamine deacetylase [Verrucomicrobiota bacterium]MBU6445837.1 UDP-3-O-[3-hydroxymyristoyl] N-acetylglucosamine deacetylase [Verrucomicrobiota bacterium]MDE3046742.1 UDP-3-O-[3-hydroxymyristoyl] N-acetylglucosamine deacetylase [Verrucomicrobiota bacterium]